MDLGIEKDETNNLVTAFLILIEPKHP